MARAKAFPHNNSSLTLLSIELRALASRIEELAAKYERSGLNSPLQIDNQLSVEKGLLEVRKLYTSGNAKLEKAIDELDFDASRKRMNEAVAQ